MTNNSAYNPFGKQFLPVKAQEVYNLEGVIFLKCNLLRKLGRKKQLLDLLSKITPN